MVTMVRNHASPRGGHDKFGHVEHGVYSIFDIICQHRFMFVCCVSSAVEHEAVNLGVTGSNPVYSEYDK